MKTTIDIPDELYRQIKARSALEGKTVREVTIDLYRQWVSSASRTAPSAHDWLDRWQSLGRAALRDAPAGPSTREVLDRDRDRLDRP